jgi:hypothetical protein
MTAAAIRRAATTAGWPVVAGLACFIIGLLMLGATALSYQQARRLAAPAAGAPANRSLSAAPYATTPGAGSFELVAPAYATHLEDVSVVFELARQHGISLGPMNYRSEASASLPVITRVADLRLNEDYPKLKAFVADLLGKVPHLYLQEIRVDQGEAPSSTKIQATLKLSFVYQATKAK